ncbi:ABC transporter substrate-binding protein [Peribacillus asahii]|uniref:ABC transporter substrate-binding protein n=1 Tax=Peribacillus asahii TaxID=228899 RepID=A0A398BJA3_9BACI|nr:ABC transporter substrate-binding protein [Peribacillus asahii]RID87463.1 ABC transporter substrate-binding protein [Peribacillus asahii]
MKKVVSLLFVLLLSVGVMVGCSNSTKEDSASNSKEPKQAASQFPVTITDGSGEKVTIKEEPKKIVSVIPSNTEIAFALGLGDQIVGVSDYDTYPEETKDIEKIGGLEMNIEKVVSLKPDLVLAHSSNNVEGGVKQLKEMGITVLVVNDAQNFKQVYHSIEMIGTATGKTEAATVIVEDMQTKLKDVKEKVKVVTADERKKVLIEVSPPPEIYSPGKNTFMDEMLQIIQADNIAGQLEGWAKMDEEAVVTANPDVIVTTHGYRTKDPISEVLKRNAWGDITAIKNKQVYNINSDLVDHPGPRLVEGVEELGKAIYPEIFN